LVIGAVLFAYGIGMAEQPAPTKQPMSSVRSMDITGEIAKSKYGYIIRGKKPAELFTILNPDPAILDALVKSGAIVSISVRIVSGDNVNIETIDGKPYGAAAQGDKPKAPPMK